MRALYAGLAAVLAILAFAGLLNPIVVLVITAISGSVRPSDQGIRVALVADIMPADQLSTAISIARTTSDSARVAGALAGAGLFAVLGIGPATLTVAGFYLLGFLLTLGVAADRSDRRSMHPGSSPARELADGLLYIWTTPLLLAMMCLAFLANLTAFPLSHGLLPYFAREVFGTDQTGLGYLVASFAFGGLLGSVILSAFGRTIRPARTALISTVLWCALLVAFSQLENYSFAMAVLLLAGFAQSFSMVPSSILLMQASAQAYRGRVMGVRMLAVNGLPLGLLAAGALTGFMSISAVVSLFALVGIALTLAIAWAWHADLSRSDDSAAGHRASL
jgi:predicted MFS family arabinose efflux permease